MRKKDRLLQRLFMKVELLIRLTRPLTLRMDRQSVQKIIPIITYSYPVKMDLRNKILVTIEPT